jgi:hypothetical protein
MGGEGACPPRARRTAQKKRPSAKLRASALHVGMSAVQLQKLRLRVRNHSRGAPGWPSVTLPGAAPNTLLM